ncbi:hypothetical protein [Corynebacterium mastitidis]
MTEQPKNYIKEGNQSSYWLWFGVAISIILAFGSLSDLRYAPADALGGMLVAAGIGLGCGRPLWCRHQDKQARESAIRAREETERLRALLGQEDTDIVRGMGEVPDPKPHPRGWELVGPVVAGLIFLGLIIG